MVLTAEEVKTEFPGLELDTDDIGYQDNEAAARGTVDPTDTAEDLTSKGRIVGYMNVFWDVELLLEGAVSINRPVAIKSAVDLFESEDAAKTILSLKIADFHRFVGEEILEDVTLVEFEEWEAQEPIPDFVAGRATYSNLIVDGLNAVDYLYWWRGPVVAAISVVGLDPEHGKAVAAKMAMAMDRRITGVRNGEIISVPFGGAVGTSSMDPATTVLEQGYDLSAMVLRLADLPEGLAVVGDGYKEESDAVGQYHREFETDPFTTVRYRTSNIVNIAANVTLKTSQLHARGDVLAFKTLEPAALGELFGPNLFRDENASVEVRTGETLSLPAIGDAVVGFRLGLMTPSLNLDMYAILFSRGKVRAQLFVLGLQGEVRLEDIVSLAKIIEERILQHSPPLLV